MENINPANYINLEKKDSNIHIAKYPTVHKDGWEGALYRFGRSGGHRATLRNFEDLILLLKSDKRIFDGGGGILSDLERKAMIKEIFDNEKKEDEIFDNRFLYIEDKTLMLYDHRLEIRPGGDRISHSVFEMPEKLIDVGDGYAVLKDLNEHGLPKKTSLHKGSKMNVFFDGFGGGYDEVVEFSNRNGDEKILVFSLLPITRDFIPGGTFKGTDDIVLIREVRENF